MHPSHLWHFLNVQRFFFRGGGVSILTHLYFGIAILRGLNLEHIEGFSVEKRKVKCCLFNETWGQTLTAGLTSQEISTRSQVLRPNFFIFWDVVNIVFTKILKNRETTTLGLDSSFGWVPALCISCPALEFFFFVPQFSSQLAKCRNTYQYAGSNPL